MESPSNPSDPRLTIGNPFQPKAPPSRYGPAGCESRVVGAIPEWGYKPNAQGVEVYQVVGIKALIVRSHALQSRIDRHQAYCDRKGKVFQNRVA